MQELTEAAEIVDCYNRMLKQACNIINGPPYWKTIEEKTLHINFDAGSVVLTWQEANDDYGSSILEESKFAIPLDVFFLDSGQLTIWQQAREREYEMKKKIDRRNRKERTKQDELKQRAALKKKYES